jgi:hypothetical protein
MMKQIYPFLFSVEKEGLILPGGDEPAPASVEIPFQREDEIRQSMSGIRRQMIRKKLREMVPFGRD